MSSTRVRLLRSAREDLLGIWLHIARHNSQPVADPVYDRIEAVCARLKGNPMSAAARPEIGEGAGWRYIESRKTECNW